MNSLLRFSKASERNTPCYRLSIDDVTLVISYETIIAARYGGERIRRFNTWGPTTARHMRDADVKDYPEVEADEFERRVEQMVYRTIADRTARRITGEKINRETA